MLTPLLFTLLIGAIVAGLLYFFLSHSSKSSNHVLLVGSMFSGKTSLFHALCHGVYRESVTSLSMNFGDLTLNNKQYQVVDVPGHASLRVKLAELLPKAKCIVFVYDGVGELKPSSGTSQFLYNILSSSSLQRSRTRIMVAISKVKQDERNDENLDEWREKLEKIIDKTRDLQSSMSDLDDGSNDSKAQSYVGVKNQPFKLSDSACPITVGFVNVTPDDLYVDEVTRFIQSK